MRKLCLLFALAILPLLTSPLYAVSTYSDAWACDYSDSHTEADPEVEGGSIFVPVEPFDARICACSVTDGYGDGIYHELEAYVKVTGPSGSYNDLTEYSYGYGSVAIAEVSLGWGQEEGDYTITTRHMSNCPADEFSAAIFPIFIAISLTSYKIEKSSTSSCYYIKDCPPGTDGCGYYRLKRYKQTPTEACPGFYLNGNLRVNG